MQLGYVIFTALAPRAHVVAVTYAIVVGAFGLAYVVWRFFERRAHPLANVALSNIAQKLQRSSASTSFTVQ
jgi:hypothetical protein